MNASTDYQQLADRYLAAWNETDPATRESALAQLCTDDVRYTDPLADVSGVPGLAGLVGAVQDQFPGFAFTPAGGVDGHHDQVRFGWELGPAGSPAPVAGFDVVELDGAGRITRVLGFLDRVPTG